MFYYNVRLNLQNPTTKRPEFGIKSINLASFIEIVSTLLHLKVRFVRKQKWKMSLGYQYKFVCCREQQFPSLFIPHKNNGLPFFQSLFVL